MKSTLEQLPGLDTTKLKDLPHYKSCEIVICALESAKLDLERKRYLVDANTQGAFIEMKRYANKIESIKGEIEQWETHYENIMKGK